MIHHQIITKKVAFIFLAILFFLVAGTGLYVYNKYPTLIQHPRRTLIRLVNELVGSVVGTGKSAHHNIYVRDAYPLHIEAAGQYGWRPIKTKNEIRKLKQKGLLVTVTDGDGFCVSNFTSSSPTLTKSANSVLCSIGKQFAEKTGGDNYFTVTSMTRTVQQQQRLSATNSAATKGISSHSYGCSFDISYNRFNGRRGGDKPLQRILERIILNLRKENRLLLIAETSSHCYHITVKRRE